MSVLQASYIQASSHPSDTDRLVIEGLMNPPGTPTSGARYGVGSGSAELQVTQNGTPNMSVNVAAGHGWVDGTENGNQGAYHVYNDATVNLAISAADPTNPRKDLVVLKVQDAQYSGATNAASLAVVTGTPAASPAEPTVPANAIVLALVDVAASASSITNGNITDRRRRASALGGVGVCTSSTRPTTGIYEGQTIYETDTDRVLVYDGSGWVQISQLGAWSTYSPTNTNVTVGNGTQSARYLQTGRTVRVSYTLTFGSTTSFGGTVQIGLPVTAAATTTPRYVGAGVLLDSGSTHHVATAIMISTTQVRIQSHGNAAQVSNTIPFTWTTGDELSFSMTYEAA